MKEDLSIDQILKSIRKVILGKNSKNNATINKDSSDSEETDIAVQNEDENKEQSQKFDNNDILELKQEKAQEKGEFDKNIFAKKDDENDLEEESDDSNALLLKQEHKETSKYSNLKNHSDSLLSSESAASASDNLKKFANVATSVYKNNPNYRSGKTVEQLVVEVMKPHLCKWLDDNLPSIVQNLVEKEIRRLLPDDTKQDDNEI